MANNLDGELHDLTFASFDCQRNDLTLHLDITRGLHDGLDVRGEDTVVPGFVGEIPRNRVRARRTIQLDGWILGDDGSDALELQDGLAAAFAPDADPAELEGVARDGSTRSILARTMPPGPVMGAEVTVGVRRVSIVLVSVVPDWTVAEGS